MELNAFAFIIAAVGLEVLGQVSFKLGTLSISKRTAGQRTKEYLFRTFGNTWIRIGILAYMCEILFGVAALTLAPLSVVFPLLSLGYCGVAVAGRLFLGERLGRRNQAAIALITIGAAMVSWSSTH